MESSFTRFLGVVGNLIVDLLKYKFSDYNIHNLHILPGYA